MIGIVFIFMSCLIVLGFSAYSFPVQRSFQWKDHRGVEHGSQRANINLPAALPSHTLRRRAVLVRADDLDPSKLELWLSNGMEGLLIILPSQGQLVTVESKKNWDIMDNFLVQSAALKIPVFFASDCEEVRALEAEIAQSYGDIELSVATLPEAPLITKPQISSFHGWLQGLSEEASPLPTILISANYDSLGAAGLFATGDNDNGSGVAAVLELARLFSTLYHQPRNRVAINFLFLITGGSHFNFLGTEAWLAQMDKALLDRIDLAICLDSIGNSERLYLHHSRPPKTPKIKAVYDLFVEQAQQYGVDIELSRKKVNISSETIAWEHESFARKSIFSMTLSGHAPASPVAKWSANGKRSSSLEHHSGVNTTLLSRNIAFVAEVLAKHAFGFNGRKFNVFEGSLAVDQASVEAWVKILSAQHRVDPWIDKEKPHPALNLIHERLQVYTEKVVVRQYGVPSGMQFRAPVSSTMSAYFVRGVVFELLLSAGVVLYLLVVAGSLEWYTTGKINWKSYLKRD